MLDLHDYTTSMVKDENNMSLEENCEVVKKNIPDITEEDISTIEQLTKNQNKCDLWYKTRYCHITASKCHDVKARIDTLEKKSDQTCDSLLRRFLYSANVSTPAMAIGQKWEGKAFFKYKQIAEREGDVNLSVEKYGLFVSKEGVLGASSRWNYIL